jgi:hypothetical protein
MGDEPNTPPTPSVTPGTPGTTPVTGTSTGVTPTKPPTTLEEAIAKLADLEHSVSNKIEENDRKSKRIQEFEAAQKKQEQAAAKALEERLKQQGEFQKLAEQHEARVKELEPTVERYTALTSLVSEQIEAQIKDWPAEAKIFDPGKDVPIEQRLDWMNKAKALVDKLQAVPQTKPGNGPNPKPSVQTPEGYQQKIERQMRISGKYNA